jgi:hypothetical protein
MPLDHKQCLTHKQSFKDAILPEIYIQVSSSHVCYRSSLPDLITGEILRKYQELL